jgi:hypothetical protein
MASAGEDGADGASALLSVPGVRDYRVQELSTNVCNLLDGSAPSAGVLRVSDADITLPSGLKFPVLLLQEGS